MNDCQKYPKYQNGEVDDFLTTISSNLKECRSCIKMLDFNQFYSKGKDRHESVCKECSRARKVKRYKMSKAVTKRKESIGIKSIELIPTIENYKLKILRGL